MISKIKIKKYVKQHPEIFDHDHENYHSITDDQIPNISWFYERNPDLIVNKNKRLSKSKKHWYSSKRLLIPVTGLFILVFFFVATPTGRAMAETVYYTVVEWVTGEVHIWHGLDDTPPDQIDIERTTFNSVQDVNELYGISIAVPTTGILDTIEVEKTDYQIILKSTYLVSDQSSVILTQTNDDSGTETAASINFDEGQPIDEITANGIRFIGYINDHNGYAIAFYDNVTLEISADDVTYKQFTIFIQGINMP